MSRWHPDQHLAELESALDTLSSSVVITAMPSTKSHTPLVATGLEIDTVVEALATYLVGCIAGAVGFDARLSSAVLVNERDAAAELGSQVIALIGSGNDWPTSEDIKFRDTKRNAWIGEGIAHAMIVVHQRRVSPLLTGPLLAVSLLHTIPSEPGLDAVGIYEENGETVLLIGESKATQRRGSQELGKAAALFAKVDGTLYGPELRGHLASLRHVVPEPHRSSVSDSLWRERRAYLPFVAHEASFPITGNRKVIERLMPAVHRKRLVSIQLSDFHDFFDRVADRMRLRVEESKHV
jgi:hypothetical protein